MIRVNLLGTPRTAASSWASDPARLVPAASVVVLLLAGGIVGWRYVALQREGTRLTADLEAATQESARLAPVLAQVKRYEQQKTDLAQRVGVIEALRLAQTGPVRLLDQVSHVLPDGTWLTELRQDTQTGAVLFDGQCLSLIALSDFVAGLQRSGLFTGPVDIVTSSTEPGTKAGLEIIKFQLRAPLTAAAPTKGR